MMLLRIADAHEFSGEVVVELVSAIERKELWTAGGITKEDLWREIQYNTHLRPMIEFHNRNNQRKKNVLAAIARSWGEE